MTVTSDALTERYTENAATADCGKYHKRSVCVRQISAYLKPRVGGAFIIEGGLLSGPHACSSTQ